MNTLIKRSFLNALGTVAYITLVALIFACLQKFAGNKPDGFLAPVLALTLFVLSASITGSLVLGKPVLMYMNGEKTDALKLFFYTLGWLTLALATLLFVTLI